LVSEKEGPCDVHPLPRRALQSPPAQPSPHNRSSVRNAKTREMEAAADKDGLGLHGLEDIPAFVDPPFLDLELEPGLDNDFLASPIGADAASTQPLFDFLTLPAPRLSDLSALGFLPGSCPRPFLPCGEAILHPVRFVHGAKRSFLQRILDLSSSTAYPTLLVLIFSPWLDPLRHSCYTSMA
jgi:hypothetical protein